MFAVYTFVVALILLSAFVIFRMWEEKRGIRMWARAREGVDMQVVEVYQSAVTGSIPQKYRIQFFAFLQHTVHQFVLLLVATLRAVERPLTRISYRMRMSASNTNKKEVSPFLQTIVPEKPDTVSGDGTGQEKSV